MERGGKEGKRGVIESVLGGRGMGSSGGEVKGGMNGGGGCGKGK